MNASAYDQVLRDYIRDNNRLWQVSFSAYA